MFSALLRAARGFTDGNQLDTLHRVWLTTSVRWRNVTTLYTQDSTELIASGASCSVGTIVHRRKRASRVNRGRKPKRLRRISVQLCHQRPYNASLVSGENREARFARFQRHAAIRYCYDGHGMRKHSNYWAEASSTSRASTNSSSGRSTLALGKRKPQSKDGDSDDEEWDSRKRSKPSLSQSPSEEKKFACPVYQHDPFNSRNARCAAMSFSDIARIK